MNENMDVTSQVGRVERPTAIKLSAIMGGAGALVTIASLFMPFLSVVPATIETVDQEDIVGSYFSSPLIENKTMGILLLLLSLVVLCASLCVLSQWQNRLRLFIIMLLQLGAGSCAVLFCVLYGMDPNVHEALDLGAHIGMGLGMAVVGAIVLTSAGLTTLIARIQQQRS